jgi:hypothetical protein
MTVSVCSQLHYISSRFDGSEKVRAETLRRKEQDANRLLGDVEKPEVSIADPWDPPEGFITFGSIFTASRAIAYTVNYYTARVLGGCAETAGILIQSRYTAIPLSPKRDQHACLDATTGPRHATQRASPNDSQQ